MGDECLATDFEHLHASRHHALPYQERGRRQQDPRKTTGTSGPQLLRRRNLHRGWRMRERGVLGCSCSLRKPLPGLRSPPMPASHRLEDLRHGDSNLGPGLPGLVCISHGWHHLEPSARDCDSRSSRWGPAIVSGRFSRMSSAVPDKSGCDHQDEARD